MSAMASRLLAMGSILIFMACSGTDENNDGYKDILASPVFAGISDSIKKSPGDPELLLTRAFRLSQHNYHKAATADYQKAYEITGDADVALAYTSNLILAGDTQEAIQLLQQANDKFPENTEFSRRLAEIYLQRGDNMRAMQHYDEMLSRDSTNFEAWLEIGSMLLKKRDTAAAIRALEKSFAIMPINHTGMALATVYVARKDPRALEICDIILERDTANMQTEAVFMKGIYYAETGNDKQAIEQFDECIRRDWKMTDAYIEKGIVYFEQQQYDEALNVFELAFTVSNTDADVYFWLARCFEAKGDTDRAITNYRRALALDDTFSEAREGISRLER